MYGAIIGAGVGLLQTAISAGKAKNMKKPQGFSVSPEMRSFYNMARKRADEGHSPEEKAYFDQLIARGGTATRRTLQNVGLAEVGSAAANIMGIDATNQFVNDGAKIKRDNFSILGQAAGDIQSVQNMQSQQELSQYNTESQALGGGIQAGIGNIIGGLQSIDNEQGINKAAKMYSQGGLGSGGTSNTSLVGGNGGNAGLGGGMNSGLGSGGTSNTSLVGGNGGNGGNGGGMNSGLDGYSHAPMGLLQQANNQQNPLFNPNFQGGSQNPFFNPNFRGRGVGMYSPTNY